MEHPESISDEHAGHAVKNLPSRIESLMMMIITGTYLLFEVAFGARLLDVVGSTTDLHEIEQIETAGRFISGIALTLVVWTTFILPRIRRMNVMTAYKGFKSFAMLTLSAAACCLASYTIQEAILDGISEGSSAAQRQAASTLTLVSSSVQNSTAILKGIDFESVDRQSPELKTFLALLPSLALSVERLEDRTRESIEELLTAQAVEAIGGPEKFHSKIYYPTMNSLKKGYNEVYLEAAANHSDAISRIRPEQDRLYRNFRNSLGGPKITPTTLPKHRHAEVRNRLRSGGVPVSIDWELTDKSGFYEAVDKRIRSEVTPAYEKAMMDVFGVVPPDNLGGTSFFADATVQKAWRSLMGLSFDIPIGLDLDLDAAVTTIYLPWIRSIVDEKRPLYFSPIEDFEVGGQYYADGITAIRVAYVPLIAFGFSLLGALVHSFKTLNFAFKIIVGVKTSSGYRMARIGKISIACCVAMTAVVISTIENPVTRSELFRELEASTKQRMGVPVSISMRTVIQLQPFAYPIAEVIRRDVLFGITYDFDPDTEIPAFEALSEET